MSREIKFRAWDKVNKIMTYNSINAINFDGQILLNDGKFYDINKTDYILMQYTNFVDANGIKIFEGDVVKSNNNHLFVINFKYGSFGANWIKDDFVWHSFATNSFIEKKFEVIGNIYENPELITEVKNV